MNNTLPVGLLLAATTVAHAETASVLHGDHSNYGRIVIETPERIPATIDQQGTTLRIKLASPITVETPARVPRNVQSFAGGAGMATIRVTQGARIKHAQSGQLIIVDVLDPPRGRQGAPIRSNRPNPEFGRTASATVPPAAPPSAAVAELRRSDPAATQPAPAETVQAGPPVSAQPAPVQVVPAQPAAFAPIHVATGLNVGAAAFRRGDLAVVVFDDLVSIDPDELAGRDPALALRQRQGATMLTLPLPPGSDLSLEREDGGWVIQAGSSGKVLSSPLSAQPDGIAFEFTRPGRTLTIRDPITDQLLLVGTSRQASGAKAYVPDERTAPGYVILPTWIGIALEATSDRVDLRVEANAFKLHLPFQPSAVAAVQPVPENPFAIPQGAVPELARSLTAEVASAAVAPPRSRGVERVAAARTMLALGMAKEAQALLALAVADDAQLAADPKVLALQGIAAVLDGRPGEATGLDSTDLPANADIALWRAIRDSEQGDKAQFQPGAWTRLASYPEAIRRQIGPVIMESAVTSGETVPDSALAPAAFSLARAYKYERDGKTEQAMTLLDTIVAGRDEKESVRAVLAETDLQLKTGKITPNAAAEAVEQQAVRWRGDGTEAQIRLRAAQLRRRGGEWREAAAILRETETLFPNYRDKVVVEAQALIRAVLAADQSRIAPLDLIALAGDLSRDLPSGDEGDQMASLLADKLAALDLPTRAIPVLQRLQDTATSDKAKARYAVRLAQLQLDAGDPGQVAKTLAFDPAVLDPASAEKRMVLLARAQAAGGHPDQAADSLAAMDDPGAEELRADLLAKAGNWSASAQAYRGLIAKSVPSAGPLTDKQQDVLLRAATAAVHAGTPELLADLAPLAPRLTGARADLFRVLTATPVQSANDLPRAARELAMARVLPAKLNALQSDASGLAVH